MGACTNREVAVGKYPAGRETTHELDCAEPWNASAICCSEDCGRNGCNDAANSTPKFRIAQSKSLCGSDVTKESRSRNAHGRNKCIVSACIAKLIVFKTKGDSEHLESTAAAAKGAKGEAADMWNYVVSACAPKLVWAASTIPRSCRSRRRSPRRLLMQCRAPSPRPVI